MQLQIASCNAGRALQDTPWAVSGSTRALNELTLIRGVNLG